ncbi:ABC transporter permease [Mangrovimonas spongiae]|uniref:ABC transporter permease n=1 Tax=Mangrovimonas spongiae TaxID=2494697 RepID=A0A3R9NS48_9FLAO|nr:ABC transporter permease [Mangrovimonas spongiae]RSK40523.1 ABC transporter permease [Mangrovimonas spongiae]
MSLETRVYQKENNLRFGRLLRASLTDIISSRFLATQLAVRDIKAQYRQSYFGILWAFITPLTTAFVWIFLNSTGTIRLTDTGVPYPVYAFSGTLLWSIIKESINTPMSSTNAAKSILTKINFPKEALVVSGIFKLLFNSAIKVLLLVVFIFVFGVGFHWSLLLLPFALLAAVFFGITIGLFITPIGMLYKDVSRLISFGLGFVMYVTPVVYAIPKEGIMRSIMLWNPFTPIIVTARDMALGQPLQFLPYYIGLLLVCVPLLCLGLVFYRLSIPIIVERMSA